MPAIDLTDGELELISDALFEFLDGSPSMYRNDEIVGLLDRVDKVWSDSKLQQAGHGPQGPSGGPR